MAAKTGRRPRIDSPSALIAVVNSELKQLKVTMNELTELQGGHPDKRVVVLKAFVYRRYCMALTSQLRLRVRKIRVRYFKGEASSDKRKSLVSVGTVLRAMNPRLGDELKEKFQDDIKKQFEETASLRDSFEALAKKLLESLEVQLENYSIEDEHDLIKAGKARVALSLDLLEKAGDFCYTNKSMLDFLKTEGMLLQLF